MLLFLIDLTGEKWVLQDLARRQPVLDFVNDELLDQVHGMHTEFIFSITRPMRKKLIPVDYLGLL